MYFASINDDGYCVSISSYSADNVITNPYVIGIDSYDISFIGRRYDFEECVWTDEWEERPIETKIEPTQLDRIEEAVLKTQDEIKQEAIDNYTIQLIEEGLI